MKKAQLTISDPNRWTHPNDPNYSGYSDGNSGHSDRSDGFSLVEVLLAVSIFGLIVTGLVGGLIFGQQSTALSGQRARAVLLADEGLEAVRNIRDAGYSNLTDGTFGLTTTGNQWNLSGSSDTTDIFTRALTISTVDANRKQIAATVTWQQNAQRTGSAALTTYITNWKASAGGGLPPTSCTVYCQALPTGYTSGTCRQNSVQCTNNSEVYESGGDSICATNFPGDTSQNTCCCLP